jgi:hypothetical protein
MRDGELNDERGARAIAIVPGKNGGSVSVSDTTTYRKA